MKGPPKRVSGGLAFDSLEPRDAGLGCATSNLTTTLTRRTVSMVLGRLRPEGDRGAFDFALSGGFEEPNLD